MQLHQRASLSLLEGNKFAFVDVQKEVRKCPRYLRMSLQLFHIYSGEDSVPQGPGMVQTKPAVN